MDLHEIRRLAQGRWADIHTALGVPRRLLNPMRHFPCPYCGGKDRFRFTDYQGNGGFICNQCTPTGGSGFDLLMLVLGWDFATAAREVALALGLNVENAPRSYQALPNKAPQKPTEYVLDALPNLMAIWQESAPLSDLDHAVGYLRNRGLALATLPQNIRFHANLPYWLSLGDGKAHCLAKLPAMVAAIRDASGQLQGLHLTYLQAQFTKTDKRGNGYASRWLKAQLQHPETGEALPAKKMRSRFSGSLRGCAVQLATPAKGVLCVAEGIETALAAQELFAMPVWACLSAGGLRSLALPDDLKRLLIVADNDVPRPVGWEAGRTLATRVMRSGISVQIWQPERQGYDALDELNRHKRPAYRLLQELDAKLKGASK